MRKIVVNDFTYLYSVGKNSCVIKKDGDTKKHIVALSSISPYDYERGRWKRATSGMITPKMIAFFISIHL